MLLSPRKRLHSLILQRKMSRLYVKLQLSDFDNSQWVHHMVAEGVVEMPNDNASSVLLTGGRTIVTVEDNQLCLTFLDGGTISSISNTSRARRSRESYEGTPAINGPNEEVLKRARVSNGGERKHGMYVDRFGKGVGSFDVLSFPDKPWGLKLGYARNLNDKYTWKLSVVTKDPAETEAEQEMTLSTPVKRIFKPKLLNAAQDMLLTDATKTFQDMVQESSLHKQLEALGCSESEKSIVTVNLTDQLLVTLTEHLACEGYGFIWAATKDLYQFKSD
jgi:hypothetical protein